MLRSLYGGCILPDEWNEYSWSILKAASKYGFIKLKSEAEMWYIKSCEFTVDNVIDEFLKADGSHFTLVREAAKEFMAEHGQEIIASESFDRLYESKSLMKEVMTAVAQNKNKRKRSS
jgi:hypothetical protein